MASERPLKILHLTGEREDAGGVLSVIRNLQQAGAGDGWRHVVWVNQAYEETRRPSLEYRRSCSAQAESRRHFDLLRQAFPATRELLALRRAEYFDVIHAHSRGALLVALFFSWRTRQPVLFTNHNYANRTGLYRWAARRKHLHTVMLTLNMTKHYRLHDQNGRIRTISACYGDEFLQRPPAERRNWHTPGRPVRLIGIGSIIGWKKWDLLIEAIRRLPKARQKKIECHIWGPTLQLSEAQMFSDALRRKIEHCGLNDQVRLCGPAANITAKLLQSDLFVLPSTNEPCSVALMEALALGLPAIASASGGNVDIVKPGCGLLFQPEDANSLKQCLERALNSPNPFEPPASIRDSVRHRCASQIFGAYQKIYRDLAPPTLPFPKNRNPAARTTAA